MAKKDTKHIDLEQWVKSYSDVLYSWAFYKTNSKVTAEDLIQDTFLSAFKSYEACKNKDKPKNWLFSILNHKISDYYRKAAKEWTATAATNVKYVNNMIANMFDKQGSWTSEAQNIIEQNETHILDNQKFNKVLKYCINDLPDSWRVAVLLKYIEGKKGNEICKELSITPSNYWQILHRAKAFLKICLEKNWSE